MKLAVDTNLLAYETPRRFLRNVAQHLGINIFVLPQVHEEALRRIERTEQEHWTEKLEELPDYDDTARGRIVSAAGTAAKEWLDEQCRRQGSGLVLVRPNFDQQWQAHQIARNLPAGVVKKGLTAPLGDPLILAQTAVHGMTLLSTNNFKTIHHENANEWFQNQLGKRYPIVRMPDETIDVLADQTRATATMWTLGYGPNWTQDPAAPRGDEDAARTLYEAALERLEGAGFTTTAQHARWTYENEQAEPGEFCTTLRAALNACRSRDAEQTEQQRRDAIRTAAKDADFER